MLGSIKVPFSNQSCQLSGPAKRLKTCLALKLKSLSTNTGRISHQTVPDCPRNQDGRISFTWVNCRFRRWIHFNLSSNSTVLILVNMFNTVPANWRRWFRQTDSNGAIFERSTRAVAWWGTSGESLKLKMNSFTPMKHEQPFGLPLLVLPFPLEEGSESEYN